MTDATWDRARVETAVANDESLAGADLREADLRWANLREADLREANLREANLRRANLREADLCGADLCETDLRWADLREANLCGANLRETDLRRANLREADLCGADLPDFQIPQEGELIVWKATSAGLAKLRVPPTAARTASLIGRRKCRAEMAEVLELIPPDAVAHVSKHDQTTKYVAGEMVRPDKYDPDIRVECSHGIHFFLTREEAEQW